VAGTLVHQENRDAAADHAPDINASVVSAHRMYAEEMKAENQHGSFGLGVTTTSDFYAASIQNFGSGAALVARTEGANSAVGGVAADATVDGFGVTGAGAYGVFGQSITSRPGFHGVWGISSTGVGTGVFGEGKVGVRGKAMNSTGYAGVFEGGKAQLRLVPSTTYGKPTTGAHLKGELYLDRNVNLWLCTANGTPGTWKKVTLT
jgi:hypothetical protein